MPLTVSISEIINDPLRSIHPWLKSDEMAVTVLVDGEGNLSAFDVMNDPSANPTKLIDLMTHLRDAGCRPLYVSDTLSALTIRLAGFILIDLDFIIPYPISSVQYRSLVSVMENVSECAGDVSEDGSRIVEECVGIAIDHEAYQFIPHSYPLFEDCVIRLRAFMSYNPNINLNVVEFINKMVRLNGVYSDDPEASLRLVAGEFSYLFRMSTDRNGIIKVSVRRDALSKLRRDFGSALVLTTGSGWEEISRARTIRKDLLDSVYQYYHGSRWMMEYIGRSVVGSNHMFIEFLAIMIMSPVDRRTRKLLKAFDVDDWSSTSL